MANCKDSLALLGIPDTFAHAEAESGLELRVRQGFYAQMTPALGCDSQERGYDPPLEPSVEESDRLAVGLAIDGGQSGPCLDAEIGQAPNDGRICVEGCIDSVRADRRHRVTKLQRGCVEGEPPVTAPTTVPTTCNPATAYGERGVTISTFSRLGKPIRNGNATASEGDSEAILETQG